MIAIVNNVPIYRNGEALLLKKEFPEEHIIEAEDISALRDVNVPNEIDVIIMTIEQVPPLAVIPAINEVKRTYPQAGLIIVGKDHIVSEILKYLSAGVLGV